MTNKYIRRFKVEDGYRIEGQKGEFSAIQCSPHNWCNGVINSITQGNELCAWQILGSQCNRLVVNDGDWLVCDDLLNPTTISNDAIDGRYISEITVEDEACVDEEEDENAVASRVSRACFERALGRFKEKVFDTTNDDGNKSSEPSNAVRHNLWLNTFNDERKGVSVLEAIKSANSALHAYDDNFVMWEEANCDTISISLDEARIIMMWYADHIYNLDHTRMERKINEKLLEFTSRFRFK